ncbi:NADPH:quinone reductase [Haplosporangium gracile]|nr:NADPH:quinone reductase [Haplosporangium gracile]
MEKYLFPVKKNDRIVVHATAGGVGLIATQLAHHLGAHVIGIVFSDEKAALACANGADHVVVISFNDYVPLEEAVSTLTSGKGVHAVYDSVGQATFESNLRIYLTTGEEFEELWGELVEFVEKGEMKVLVSKVYESEEVRQAHLDLEGRKLTGDRLWNEVFTLRLWHTIDDETLNWSNVLSDLSFNYPPHDNGDTIVEKDETWLRAILAKHGRHIRHFSMTWMAVLMNAGAEGSTITRLRSLFAKGFFQFEEKAALFDLPVLAGVDRQGRPTVEQQQVIISSYIISAAFKDALKPVLRLRLNRFIRGTVASQQFWFLVLQNPNLDNLYLEYRLINYVEQPGVQGSLKSGRYFIPIDLELDQPFPRLRAFEVKGLGPLRLASLLNSLEFLPNLEQLTINNLQPDSRYSPDKQESIADKQPSCLRGLHIVRYDQEVTTALDETIAGLVLPAMPSLNEITLRVLMPATMAALVEQCLHLEMVKIIDDIVLNKKMVLSKNMPLVLLHGCPTLKHLYTARCRAGLPPQVPTQAQHSQTVARLRARSIECSEEVEGVWV